MIRFIKWSLVFVLFCSQNGFSQHSRIFPQPQICVLSTDIFEYDGKLIVQKNEDLELMFRGLQKQLNLSDSPVLEYGSDTKANIHLSKSKSVKDGFYRLKITKNEIQIVYSDQSGLFYAFGSLFQQILNQTQIECVEVEDWSNMGYRGVHLDCARHFFTILELEEFIDQIARLKFNKFHWHLTDDQGWRLEIKKYPKLTEIGAWRDSTLIGHFSATPIVYDHERYGGFYTQEEAKSLVEYAKQRGVEIIPEIEMPGHARAALAAYPELGCTGIQQGVVGTWGVFDDVFCSKEETLSFLEDVLDEVITIFPSKTIHVGGDESPKVRWEVCPACQKQIKDHRLHNEHELQSFVIQRMSKFLSSKGRTLMGWDEILEGGLAENAQVMSWRGTEGGIAAAKAGHPVVMTPTSYCYFDYYQSGSPGEPLAIGGYLPLEKVYSFQPVPKELSESERKYILGGQANLWTEYLKTMDDVYYQEFPRLAAMSEVLWTEEKNRGSYQNFVQGVVNYLFPYYEEMLFDFSKACLEPKVTYEGTEKGVIVSTISNVENMTATIAFIDGKDKVTVTIVRDFEDNYSGEYVLAEYLDSTRSKMIVYPTSFDLEFGYLVKVESKGQVLKEMSYDSETHLALGKQLKFITPPSEKYNVNGNLGLTDGVTGDIPWKGNQWLGFENDTVIFELDFGSKTTLSEIQLGYLNEPGSWIYAPIECIIEYSNDGKKWKKTKTAMKTDWDFFNLEQKLQTRYLKFTVVNNEKIPEGLTGAGFTPWTFLDELIITK